MYLSEATNPTRTKGVGRPSRSNPFEINGEGKLVILEEGAGMEQELEAVDEDEAMADEKVGVIYFSYCMLLV